jgi:hypothetical protein
MTRARPLTWYYVVVAVATFVAIAVMLYQWTHCDGTYVRTLFWFRCMAP